MSKVYAQEHFVVATKDGEKEFKEGAVVLSLDDGLDLDQIVFLASVARIAPHKPKSADAETEDKPARRAAAHRPHAVKAEKTAEDSHPVDVTPDAKP